METTRTELVGTPQVVSQIDPTRPNWMEIDLGALDHNFHSLRKILGPDVRIHPSVKSAAYGLGVSEIARRLVSLGAETISCGSYEDARAVRGAGLADIGVVVFGSTLPAGIPSYLALDVMPTVHNFEIAEAVSSYASRPSRVYIKVDAGWGRLGFPIWRAEQAILRVARMQNIVIEGIYTHLPFSNAEGACWAQERTTLFDELIERLRKKGLSVPVTQARSSSGVLYGIKDKCNAVAPGSILYGKPSLADGVVDFSDFKSILVSIRSHLIHVSPDAADKTPGVFSRFAHQVTGATGVIPFGRKDGNRAPRPGQTACMIVKGVKVPVLSISSEQAVLDLSSVSDPKAGDEVIILGRSETEEITLADLARWQDTSMNDVLLMMRGRMPLLITK
ncbi:alanine racemase [Phyllobacterium zundukense]|uniref:Alanine racemase n=1 Tax=Phyllobacterium zundukense TaxID=1867719 RepID=A0ACD4CVA2_9HYPH|nr:alanine racemase [Phyllobacterium zundukense]UXN57522.1 alanine racemase [Phyllobacterium zundukense]